MWLPLLFSSRDEAAEVARLLLALSAPGRRRRRFLTARALAWRRLAMVSPKSGPSRRIVPCAPLRDADGDGAVPGLRIRPLLRLNGKKGKESRSSPRGHAGGIMALSPQTH